MLATDRVKQLDEIIDQMAITKAAYTDFVAKFIDALPPELSDIHPDFIAKIIQLWEKAKV